MTAHPDLFHAGLITSADQIKSGAKYWHIYGHLSCEPELHEFLTGPISHNEYLKLSGSSLQDKDSDTKDLWAAVRIRGWCTWISLMDAGIGACYNVNRYFESEASAIAYHQKCGPQQEAARVRESDYWPESDQFDHFDEADY